MEITILCLLLHGDPSDHANSDNALFAFRNMHLPNSSLFVYFDKYNNPVYCLSYLHNGVVDGGYYVKQWGDICSRYGVTCGSSWVSMHDFQKAVDSDYSLQDV